MTRQCPYLGLDGDPRQTYAVASPRHRCTAHGEAERIGTKHQSTTCLTTAFRRCPRLVAGAQVAEMPQATPEQAHAGQMERALQARPEAPYTELGTVPRRAGTRLLAIEFAVVSLVAAIVLALAFTGYAVVHRLQVGPGLGAPVSVAQATASSEAELPATLTPTYTPTPVPRPTPIVPTLVAAPPAPNPETTLPERPVADSPPTRLVIAKIGLDIPVLPVGVKIVEKDGKTRALWADVPNAGGFHETSALPGQPGNTVINGHRDIQGSVFRHLDRVEVGDEIVLYAGDVAYPYRVTETLVVPETFASAKQRAKNLRLIGTMPEERLTLVTCTPVGLATHRLLVVAKPPEQAGPDMPEAGSDLVP